MNISRTFHDGDLYLADSVSMHTILKENKYFEYLTLTKANITTISSPTNMIKYSRKSNIDVLYSHESKRNLFSFKDICVNGYHIEITDEERKEYLYITARISGQKLVLEKLPAFSSGIYYTIMKSIESNVVIHQKCSDPKQFMF